MRHLSLGTYFNQIIISFNQNLLRYGLTETTGGVAINDTCDAFRTGRTGGVIDTYVNLYKEINHVNSVNWRGFTVSKYMFNNKVEGGNIREKG